MRIDKYLKNARVIKRRTLAKEACDGGRVTINGKLAKAGSEVEVGDEVCISFGRGPMRFEILATPESVKKEDAESLYRLIGDQDA